MDLSEIVARLHAQADPANAAGMARYGISTRNTLGVSVRSLRLMAREIGRNHELALDLWETDIREARILASIIDRPADVIEAQMEHWAAGFDSWEVCDQCCSNLFRKTSFARQKALEWSRRDALFVKRAGFVLMAQLAVHDRRAEANAFDPFLDAVRREAADDRNMVKKAVNWALRQIGKRDAALNRQAAALADTLRHDPAPSARWIGADAYRELTGEAVRLRLSGCTANP